MFSFVSGPWTNCWTNDVGDLHDEDARARRITDATMITAATMTMTMPTATLDFWRGAVRPPRPRL